MILTVSSVSSLFCKAREQKGIERIQRLGSLKSKALLLGETEVEEDSDSSDSVASEDSLSGSLDDL